MTIALLTLSFVVPANAHAQGNERFARWALHDGLSLVERSLPLVPAVLVAGGLVIPAAKHFDEPLLDEVQNSYHGVWGDYLDFTNDLGDPYVLIPATSVFAVSLFTGSERFQDAAFTSVESLLFATAITGTIKQMVGRSRPQENIGSIRLRPFSGNASFPSGHVTAAFALVTPWVYYYPGPATYSLFALSGGTAIARIARDKHWPTDVLAGAAIGFLTSRWLARRHLSSANQPPVSIRPVLGYNSLGLTIDIP
ncbi:MAG: phosphatase PAP2 family protein [Rhodothermales bacterium]|nr:phosphatase PAP2 family protein [Rhodothermales bacterium]